MKKMILPYYILSYSSQNYFIFLWHTITYGGTEYLSKNMSIN